MKPRRIILTLIFAALLLFALPALAQTDNIKFEPEVPIPGTFDSTQDVNNNFLGTYIRAIYVYFVWSVGALAVVMVIYGGIKWVAASGNPSRINDARDVINNAIIGVIIALVSVVLLNLISPQFTTLSIPDLRKTDPEILALPAKQPCPRTMQVSCGQFQKVGKINIDPKTGRESAQGEEQDLYCLGTACNYSGAGGTVLFRHPQVCNISQNSGTGFLERGQGCIDTVAVEPGAGKFSSVNSMPINENLPPAQFYCGWIQDVIVGANRFSVGSFCNSDSATPNTTCYMVGQQSKIIDKPAPAADTLNNFFCPS